MGHKNQSREVYGDDFVTYHRTIWLLPTRQSMSCKESKVFFLELEMAQGSIGVFFSGFFALLQLPLFYVEVKVKGHLLHDKWCHHG